MGVLVIHEQDIDRAEEAQRQGQVEATVYASPQWEQTRAKWEELRRQVRGRG